MHTERLKKRRGRPPTITREKITQAALTVSQKSCGLSMQTVAEQLKVDVATLYRHLGSQTELNRLLAENAAPTPESLPKPDNKNLREWLHDLGWFYRKLLSNHRDLVAYAQSAMDPDRLCLEFGIKTMVQFGFSHRTAAYCHEYLINNIVGFVYQQLRNEQEISEGRGVYIEYQKAITTQGPEKLPNVLSSSLTAEDFDADKSFSIFLDISIDGVCAQIDK